MLKEALLLYQKLVGCLESIVFELNSYDLCVANKIINGKQMTLTYTFQTFILLYRHFGPMVTVELGSS